MPDDSLSSMSQLYSNCNDDDCLIVQATDDERTAAYFPQDNTNDGNYFPQDDSNDSNYSGTRSQTPSDCSQAELEHDIEEEFCRTSYSLVETDDKLNGMLLTPMS